MISRAEKTPHLTVTFHTLQETKTFISNGKEDMYFYAGAGCNLTDKSCSLKDLIIKLILNDKTYFKVY